MIWRAAKVALLFFVFAFLGLGTNVAVIGGSITFMLVQLHAEDKALRERARK